VQAYDASQESQETKWAMQLLSIVPDWSSNVPFARIYIVCSQGQDQLQAYNYVIVHKYDSINLNYYKPIFLE